MYKHYYTAREIKEQEAQRHEDEKNYYLIDMALVGCLCTIVGIFLGYQLCTIYG